MPVNEKILFGSFQYLFSLKTIIYAILSSEMLREINTVLGGENIDFRGGGGGGINIRFRPKYRPLLYSMYSMCDYSSVLGPRKSYKFQKIILYRKNRFIMLIFLLNVLKYTEF
jgi:hypothetical protein